MPLTLGELLVRRKLEPWNGNAGMAGTPSYKPGQHKATLVTRDTVILSWVDDSGAACQVFGTHIEDDDEWRVHPQLLRAGAMWIELRPVPRAFAMSDFWLREIAAAQSGGAQKKRRPRAGSKPENDAPSNGAEESDNDTA
jgi:hypothetical protein